MWYGELTSKIRPVLLQDRMRPQNVLVRIGRLFFENERVGWHTIGDGKGPHYFGLLKGGHEARRENQVRPVTGMIQVNRLTYALLEATAGLPGLANPTREDHDRISRLRWCVETEWLRDPPQYWRLEEQEVHDQGGGGELHTATRGRSIKAS
jgi:hypothetical protein